MRSKSKSSTEMVLDYSKCKYETIVTKKKFLGMAKRYLYIFDNEIIINKEARKKKPDRILLIELTKRVIWKYCEKRHPGRKVLKGFTLDYVSKSHEYFGEELALKDLKRQFAAILFQARVQDEYEAQCVVGQGNYALVLELKHLHSNIKLASKCIDKKKLEKIENGMKSVLNEINIMRALSPHNQIVNLHEVYEGDNNIYLIMDLAEGGSLYHEMKNRKYLFSRKEIQMIMQTLLSALAYMHSKGIMHRDLKPENILYAIKGDYATLKVADFGLSTFANDTPYLYPKCGTPGFVAPEVANLTNKSEGYDVRCDVFSAGVIFHVLLFGEGLFAGKGHVDILKLNKKCEINLFHKKFDMIDADAKDLLFRLIEKDPQLRITAAQALKHCFFDGGEQLIPYPKLLKESSTGNGEVKPITPGAQSPFHNYMATQGAEQVVEDPKSPGKQTPIHQREKQHSIVTRTPIYREHQPVNKEQQFSDFALEQAIQIEYRFSQNQGGEQEVIYEESKEEGTPRRVRMHSLQPFHNQFKPE